MSSGDSSDSISTSVLIPRHHDSMDPARTDPPASKSTYTRQRASLMWALSIRLYLSICVSRQKPIDAVKYSSGVGYSLSPPRTSGSSLVITNSRPKCETVAWCCMFSRCSATAMSLISRFVTVGSRPGGTFVGILAPCVVRSDTVYNAAHERTRMRREACKSS